ncbi:MAG: GTPase Era [Bacteroidales bacterium]|jgi:GTP-binding protein Era|nr:GTPase Era [Bacteroidales bacterium]
MEHKAGYVNIIGNPNVGKSTIMNALVGERLSIITQKSNTTRHRIMGIVNGDDYQIIYSDTPGLLSPTNKLHKSMMAFVKEALADADIFLVVTELGESIRNNDTLDYISQSNVPTILVVNKIDLSSEDIVKVRIKEWETRLPQAVIIPCSAITGFGIAKIFDTIISMLPVSPAYFEKDRLTDRSLRFFAAEIIRKQILLTYKKEIPYCVEVAIERFEEKKERNVISAVIYVERESQKAIIIGHGGEMLKRIGTAARKDIEDFTQKACFLELFVKVSDSWRQNDTALRRFGYKN